MLSGHLIPIQREAAVIIHANSRPVPVPKRHLSSLISTVRRERVIQQRFGLVNWSYVVVSCRVEECDYRLRSCISGELSVRAVGLECPRAVVEEGKEVELRPNKEYSTSISRKSSYGEQRTREICANLYSASECPSSTACSSKSTTLTAFPFNSSSFFLPPPFAPSLLSPKIVLTGDGSQVCCRSL